MWSSGKDSALALDRARRAGLDVRTLLTFFDPETDRIRFHATRRELVDAQAAATGLELRLVAAPWPEMPRRLEVVLAELAGAGFEGVVLGDIHLADVRAWYEARVRAAGLEHVEPIWGEAPQALLDEFVLSGGRAVVTCVDCSRLAPDWLGRVVDPDFAQEIAASGADPCGENGEYHSFAFAGPAFRRPVRWVAGETHSDGRFLQLDLTAAS